MTKEIAIVLALLATPAHAETCIASWYGKESGPYTASGERFDENRDTCARRSHHWGWVTVTNLHTGSSVRCWHNDYGPAAYTGRCIDVSRSVAGKLGFERAGTAKVSVE